MVTNLVAHSNRNVPSDSPGGQQSKLAVPGLISRCWQGHDPSRGSRGRGFLPLPSLVASGVPLLVAASLHSQISPWSLCLLLPCVAIFSPFACLLQGHLRLHLGPTGEFRIISRSHTILSSIAPTKTLFPKRVPFTGPRDYDLIFAEHYSAQYSEPHKAPGEVGSSVY